VIPALGHALRRLESSTRMARQVMEDQGNELEAADAELDKRGAPTELVSGEQGRTLTLAERIAELVTELQERPHIYLDKMGVPRELGSVVMDLDDRLRYLRDVVEPQPIQQQEQP
jgi:hypothetical protein